MEDRLEFLLIVVGIIYVGLTNKAQEILRTFFFFNFPLNEYADIGVKSKPMSYIQYLHRKKSLISQTLNYFNSANICFLFILL